MIPSIDAEKAFDKIPYPFLMKILRLVGIEGTYFNIIEDIYKRPTVNIILNRGKFDSISLKVRNRTEVPTLTTIFNVVLEVLTSAIKQQKRNK